MAAEKQFREALAIMPNYAYAHYHLGIALQRQGKEKEALGSFLAAVRIEIEAHYNLGNLLLSQNDPIGAMSRFHDAVEIDPDFVQAPERLGDLYTQQKTSRKALHHYREAKRIKPDVQGH